MMKIAATLSLAGLLAAGGYLYGDKLGLPLGKPVAPAAAADTGLPRVQPGARLPLRPGQGPQAEGQAARRTRDPVPA